MPCSCARGLPEKRRDQDDRIAIPVLALPGPFRSPKNLVESALSPFPQRVWYGSCPKCVRKGGPAASGKRERAVRTVCPAPLKRAARALAVRMAPSRVHATALQDTAADQVSSGVKPGIALSVDTARTGCSAIHHAVKHGPERCLAPSLVMQRAPAGAGDLRFRSCGRALQKAGQCLSPDLAQPFAHGQLHITDQRLFLAFRFYRFLHHQVPL